MGFIRQHPHIMITVRVIVRAFYQTVHYLAIYASKEIWLPWKRTERDILYVSSFIHLLITQFFIMCTHIIIYAQTQRGNKLFKMKMYERSKLRNLFLHFLFIFILPSFFNISLLHPLSLFAFCLMARGEMIWKSILFGKYRIIERTYVWKMKLSQLFHPN